MCTVIKHKVLPENMCEYRVLWPIKGHIQAIIGFSPSNIEETITFPRFVLRSIFLCPEVEIAKREQVQRVKEQRLTTCEVLLMSSSKHFHVNHYNSS